MTRSIRVVNRRRKQRVPEVVPELVEPTEVAESVVPEEPEEDVEPVGLGPSPSEEPEDVEEHRAIVDGEGEEEVEEEEEEEEGEEGSEDEGKEEPWLRS